MALLEKGEGKSPNAALPHKAYAAEIDFLAGILIGLGLVSEGSLSLIAHEYTLAGWFKVLGAVMLFLTATFFFIRSISKRPRAGEALYTILLGLFFFVLVGFVIWSAVAAFRHE